MILGEEETRAQLRAEKKHTIRIKPEENNPKYTTEFVYVNGVCYRIPVGEEVEVPETIYQRLLVAKKI